MSVTDANEATAGSWLTLLALNDQRRRVAELAALNDLGVRLAAMRDLDPLLQEVVTQARRLLDVDVAYLALAQPDRALTIEVTDGSIGGHLRGVRMAPHSGLAGQVLDRGEPVSTQDYLADGQLTHDERLDRVAVEEGLRTITGVPLRLRSDVIGVLMTAQRAVHPPTADDLSLLTSLAALASVAIENARLFAQHETATAALAAANEELRRTAESVNRAVVLHEQLMQVALSGGGVPQVLESLSEVVEGEVLFVDPRDDSADHSARRTVVTDDGVIVPVTSGDIYFGALHVRGAAEYDEGTVRLLERSALTLALIKAVEQQVLDAERRTVDEFVDQLVSRRLGAGEIAQRQALAAGFDLTRPHVVLVVEPEDVEAEAVRRWGADLVGAHGGLVGSIFGLVVVLVRDSLDIDQLCTARAPIKAVVGVGGPASGGAELASAFDDAKACLHALQALGERQRVATADHLGPFRFLLSTAGRDDARRFVERTIGALLEHDERRGTDLVETTRQYLANGQRHTDTARALGVHPNTLYQRLSRLDKVLGPGWLHESRCLEIQLALRVDALIRDSSTLVRQGAGR